MAEVSNEQKELERRLLEVKELISKLADMGCYIKVYKVSLRRRIRDEP